MKLKVLCEDKLYVGQYRALDEVKPVNVFLLQDFILRTALAKKEVSQIKSEINSANLNVEFYSLEVGD